MQFQQRPESGTGYAGNSMKNGCELPLGCWKSNPGLQEEQQVLLTTEPSLQDVVQRIHLNYTSKAYLQVYRKAGIQREA